MKAFLLSAGLGTRLHPITSHTPKCLVQVQGKPLIQWWVELFHRYGVTDVLINTHHLGEQVDEYLSKTKTNISWTIVKEEKLLGSAGTLRVNKSYVKDEEDFLIMYGDVLTDCNLTKLITFHKRNNSPFTMTLSEVENPHGKGLAKVKDNGTVSEFIEKPLEPISNLANMGIYVCKPFILDLIPEQELTDIASDLLPKLINQMMGYKSSEYFCDIGTFEHLKIAENTFKK